MTFANTYLNLNKIGDNGFVVKDVLYFGNHVYLWDTDNGHEFNVLRRLKISKINSKKKAKLVKEYETKWTPRNIIDAVKVYENREITASEFIERIKRGGGDFNKRMGNGAVYEGEEAPRKTGANEQSSGGNANNTINGSTEIVRSEDVEAHKKAYENNDVILQKLNNYVEDVTTQKTFGRLISKRLPQEVERSLHEGERTNKIDAFYSRASEEASRENGQAVKGTGDKGQRVEETKKKFLKEWALASGNWQHQTFGLHKQQDSTGKRQRL